MKNDSILSGLGMLVGLATVLGIVVCSNKKIRGEIEDQVDSVLKSTKKIVRHYRNASQVLAPEQYDVDNEDSRPKNEWEKALNLAEQRSGMD